MGGWWKITVDPRLEQVIVGINKEASPWESIPQVAVRRKKLFKWNYFGSPIEYEIRIFFMVIPCFKLKKYI